MAADIPIKRFLDGLILLLLILLLWGSWVRYLSSDAKTEAATNQVINENSIAAELGALSLNMVELALPAPPNAVPQRGREMSSNSPESGKGPVIELHWPSKLIEREQLYTYLHQCQGMRLAILVQQRAILLEKEAKDSGGLSGVARLVSGPLSQHERHLLQQAEQSGEPLRLLPASFDRKVIQALKQAQGNKLEQVRSISAHYRLNGQQLTLEGIWLDGKQLPGVVLPLASGCQNS